MDTDREYFERYPKARVYFRKPLDGEIGILKSVGKTELPQKVRVIQLKRGIRVRSFGDLMAIDEDNDHD